MLSLLHFSKVITLRGFTVLLLLSVRKVELLIGILTTVAVPDVPEVEPVGGGGEGGGTGGEQPKAEEASASKTDKPAKTR